MQAELQGRAVPLRPLLQAPRLLQGPAALLVAMSGAEAELFRPTAKQRKGKQASRRGADRERAVRDLYRDRGWAAFRVSDSSVCDVVAVKGEVRFIEVKSTAAGPYNDFGPADREALQDAAIAAGAVAWLAWWPPRGDLREISEYDWPERRSEAS